MQELQAAVQSRAQLQQELQAAESANEDLQRQLAGAERRLQMLASQADFERAASHTHDLQEPLYAAQEREAMLCQQVAQLQAHCSALAELHGDGSPRALGAHQAPWRCSAHGEQPALTETVALLRAEVQAALHERDQAQHEGAQREQALASKHAAEQQQLRHALAHKQARLDEQIAAHAAAERTAAAAATAQNLCEAQCNTLHDEVRRLLQGERCKHCLALQPVLSAMPEPPQQEQHVSAQNASAQLQAVVAERDEAKEALQQLREQVNDDSAATFMHAELALRNATVEIERARQEAHDARAAQHVAEAHLRAMTGAGVGDA